MLGKDGQGLRANDQGILAPKKRQVFGSGTLAGTHQRRWATKIKILLQSLGAQCRSRWVGPHPRRQEHAHRPLKLAARPVGAPPTKLRGHASCTDIGNSRLRAARIPIPPDLAPVTY